MEAIAAVLFALAALGGIAMAVPRLRGRPMPDGRLAAGHGVLAGAGVVVYLIAVLGAEEPAGLAVVALVLFVVAALGGTGLLLGFHLRRRPLPVALVVVHGLIAVVAYALLLVVLLGDGVDAGA